MEGSLSDDTELCCRSVEACKPVGLWDVVNHGSHMQPWPLDALRIVGPEATYHVCNNKISNSLGLGWRLMQRDATCLMKWGVLRVNLYNPLYIYIYIGSIHFLRRCTIHRSEINDMLQRCSNVLGVRGVLGDSPGLNYSEAPEDFRQPWDHRTQHDGFWSGEDGRNMKKLVTSRTM